MITSTRNIAWFWHHAAAADRQDNVEVYGEQDTARFLPFVERGVRRALHISACCALLWRGGMAHHLPEPWQTRKVPSMASSHGPRCAELQVTMNALRSANNGFRQHGNSPLAVVNGPQLQLLHVHSGRCN